MKTGNILIAGYGNSLAGDDAIGFYTVQKLVGTQIPQNVTVKYIHQLMPEHASEFTEYDKIIFIDAEESDKAGEVRYRRIVLSDLKDTAATAHEFTLDTIILMGYWLYGKLPEIHLVTVTGINFNTGEDLTCEVRNSIPEVIDTVFSIIHREEPAHSCFV